MASDHEALIANFVEVTSASPQDARHYLENTSWDLSSALTEFFNPQEEEEDDALEPSSQSAHPPQPPQPIPSTGNMPPKPSASQPKKKFATLGDLQGGSSGPPGGGHGHGHSHGDDDDDDSDYDPNLFAGGEKSGLAVQNPDDLKKKIIDRARKNAQRPGGDDPRPAPSRFTGTARTLGGDDAPSEVIPDPNAEQPSRELVVRNLHFWADGFSVDDGPLYRFDDPRNAEILAQIKSGRAPTNILNVSQNQEVDVHLQQHSDENYKPPKKKFKAFEGSGQRLGSPTPGDSITASMQEGAAQAAAAAPKPSTSGGGQQASSVDVNESEPTLSLQIRLGDGTRLSSRFNTTHTIGDVYDFVTASSSSSQARDWVLMTTFPSKELRDKSQILGDMADFKRGGVVVQKWT